MNARKLFERAKPFVDAGLLDHADVYSVALVAPRYGEHDADRLLGLAFAARAPRLGHAGVDLTRVAEQVDKEREERHAARKDARHEARAAAVEAAHGAAGEPDNILATSHEGVSSDGEGEDDEDAALAPLPWPADAAEWAAHTLTSALVGEPDHRHTPFVKQPLKVDGGVRTLLLTRRMYREQERLAKALHARLARSPSPVAGLDATLDTLFPKEDDTEAKRAVRVAAERTLALIVGGPGTGKTYSVSRLLAALVAEPAPGGKRLDVALAAPTGKAAARMREALREALDEGAKPALALPSEARDHLRGLPAHTLHRLLGIRSDGTCRHDKSNPLPADLVVIDEVSMVDLALMRRLVEAVREDARLVLLGDRDQLASVEAGSVLADLVDAAAHPPLAGHLQQFTTSRRFASAPDIGLVAACLQSYETRHEDLVKSPKSGLELAVSVLRGEKHAAKEPHHGTSGAATVSSVAAPSAPTPWHARQRITHLGDADRPARGAPRPTPAQLDALVAPYLAGFYELGARRENGDSVEPDTLREGYASLVKTHCVGRKPIAPEVQRQILDAFDRYRVLAVHRAGPLGVSGLERALANRVREYLDRKGSGRFWVGRPILVTQNAYDVNLMNGDVGIVLWTEQGLAAVFPGDDKTSVRSVATARLPPHEGALAMTVHKSQGSQFERVALVLAGRSSPIQTRELVYTGVTRAKNQLAWLGDASELKDALDRRVTRESGLVPLLTQTTP
jgi:exodeoxyribonuclease V alpha subunit